MNDDALRRLGQHAKEWATAYTRIVEELIQRGVPETEAREAATNAANHAATADWFEAKDRGPEWDEL